MRKIVIALILLFVVSATWAEKVSRESARKVAQNFYFEVSNMDYDEIKFSDDFYHSTKSATLFYVFNVENKKGFVVVSADDRVVPVLTYATEGQFIKNDNDMPPAFKYWLNRYEHGIGYAIENDYTSSEETPELWEKYAKDELTTKRKSGKDVDPLLGDLKWGQTCYYNEYCPSEATANTRCYHTPTGCVATAMSQIMKYHAYPTQGVGSHSYYANNASNGYGDYGLQTANFGETTYNWANMPDKANKSNSDLATICYHAGVSVDMKYGPSSSGAISSTVDDAFENYFNYSADATFKRRYQYTEATWKNYLTTDIDNGLPVYYTGADATSGGGHAFVCDGYQGTDYFHFNWGWNGSYNSYNYIDDMEPGGTGTGGGTGVYNDSQDAVFQIHPIAASPITDFVAVPTIVVVGNPVYFTDKSMNAPTSWSWNFGDGNTSSIQNPSHTYSSIGNYSVSLYSANSYGNNTKTKQQYISVIESGENSSKWYGYYQAAENLLGTGDFVYNNLYPDNSAMVQYTSSVSGAWIHGIATMLDPTSSYFSSGYLGITDDMQYYLDSVGMACRYYRYYQTEVVDTLYFDIIYDDTELNTGYWTGSSASNYGTDTLYYKRLYLNPATGEYGEYYDKSNGDFTKVNVVTVSKLLTASSLNDTLANAYGRQYFTVATPYVPQINAGSPIAVGVRFEPGHPRTLGTDTIGKNVNSIRFYSYEEQGENTYASYEKRDWNYSGIVKTACRDDDTYGYYGRVVPTWAYSQSYSYENHFIDFYLKIDGVSGTKPVADFSVDKTSGAYPLTVGFTDLSTNTPTGWVWDFGDGTISNNQSPTHIYNVEGTYTVSLTAVNAFGSDTMTKTSYITVEPQITMAADFEGTPTSGYAPLTVNFTDKSTSLNPITTYKWIFGDGTQVTTNNPSHTYNSVGKYTVVLSISDGTTNKAEIKSGYITVTQDPGDGIEEVNNPLNTIDIYPNPASSTLYLNMNEVVGKDIVIEVFDLVGKKMKDTECLYMPDGKYKINVTEIPTGVYYLKITQKESTITKRFSIVR